MRSFKRIIGAMALGLAGITSALPGPRVSQRASNLITRQNAAAQAAGLNDVDILTFALFAEFLEASFYQSGFEKFPDSDFLALGLSQEDLTNLKDVGASEQTHVDVLLSALTAQNIQPIAPCEYNFGFNTAAEMVATAAVLENVGISAYLGAAGFISSGAVLTTAASIVTVEGRHQTFIRVASKALAVPSAFDTPLTPRNVFSIASTFVKSCPPGSQLQIQAFPALTASNSATVKVNEVLQITSSTSGATHCAMQNGGLFGGSVFVPILNGGCLVPADLLAGIVYVNLATSAPTDSVLTDDITVAGPLVLQVS